MSVCAPVSLPQMDTEVCSRRILVSNLPKKVREDLLLDKLEIHFAKSKNGGGEVEDSDMLHDSGNVVITFTENNSTQVKFLSENVVFFIKGKSSD